MKIVCLVAGLLVLFAAEILRVYFIMPFPGSQQSDTVSLAYWLHQNIGWLRLAGFVFLAYPTLKVFATGGRWAKASLTAALAIYALAFYLFNFRFQADKMFYQPQTKVMAARAANKVALDKLVIGVHIGNEAKAYPVQLIGYHHQVRDTVGGTPVMVTYCTVCRTGRVFSPEVDGKPENFRLVGMDHFNAMFEDQRTGSWWRQSTGEAVAGPLKGSKLYEFPSRQMTLRAWLNENSSSLVLQPDAAFTKDYDDLALFDNGTIKSSLERRDSASWKEKSWVIGVKHKDEVKAYDWNQLQQSSMIQDSLPGLPLLLVMNSDSNSFHAWNRSLKGRVLQFAKMPASGTLQDVNTGSVWTPNGYCMEGVLKGERLEPVQAYQEFWHSWKQFQPQTAQYKAQ
ncbi:DUF3179 domain-containing (seleno)protein [Paracnuella aquatica]|uniref:DUF3179 domain-containing (seleno)protein n=1 Tax=Paracnuella aquatica TaxID=2268757 RepID=UPI000DEF2B99|nr:DUF3179 domain-containing (seleno)protein [Paracnuella aquatica]RPD51186.1 DUF3179 domain-containing protein [Paracnuella aquatica]